MFFKKVKGGSLSGHARLDKPLILGLFAAADCTEPQPAKTLPVRGPGPGGSMEIARREPGLKPRCARMGTGHRWRSFLSNRFLQKGRGLAEKTLVLGLNHPCNPWLPWVGQKPMACRLGSVAKQRKPKCGFQPTDKTKHEGCWTEPPKVTPKQDAAWFSCSNRVKVRHVLFSGPCCPAKTCNTPTVRVRRVAALLQHS